MSRKHVALVFVPLLAGAAIVGAGFSTWYFTQSSDAIASQFSATIEDARLPGGVFSFASQTTINFDQDKIAYVDEGSSFVGFGYVQHAEEGEIKVDFTKPGTENEQGVKASWVYQGQDSTQDANDYQSYLKDFSLNMESVGSFSFQDNRVGYDNLVYEVHYVVFTTGTNNDEKMRSAFQEALDKTEFTTIDGTKTTLDAVVDNHSIPETLRINVLPEVEYSDSFNRTNYDSYKAFREKVENGLTLQFSTVASVTSPKAN